MSRGRGRRPTSDPNDDETPETRNDKEEDLTCRGVWTDECTRGHSERGSSGGVTSTGLTTVGVVGECPDGVKGPSKNRYHT